jgi:uncharacterized membrane protein YraQ (UPF0718 family)
MTREMGTGNTVESSRKYYGIYFLACVLFLYLLVFLFEPANAHRAIKVSGDLLVHIVPVLVVILFFMAAVNYFANPKAVSKYVGKGSGIKGWLLAISTGILSHGPVYVWYPMLKDLRDQGMRKSLIAVFLYNRAIKIPLLPLMVYYFGVTFVVVLLLYMILASVIEGAIFEVIEGRAPTMGR